VLVQEGKLARVMQPAPHRAAAPTRTFGYREIGTREFAVHATQFTCKPNPEPRISDATCQHPMVRPKAVTPVSHSVLGTHLATSSSGFRGSRIRDASFLGVENPEMPNPDIRDLLPRVPPWIDGSRYFGKSQLGTSRGINLLYHKTPNAETPKLWIRATCPAMIDGSGRNAGRDSKELELLSPGTQNAEPRLPGIPVPALINGSR
jgi:hypothetical protein